jgi:hypothetical protein
MSSRARTTAIAVAAITALSLLAIGVLIGRMSLTRQASSGNPISVINGVPVGVSDTPAGALAADDNYLAIEAQTDEQNPRAFATLVATAFTPHAERSSLAQAAQLRGSDSSLMSDYAAGARALAVIGARRLDSYSPARARITTWLAGFLWGPTLAPEQTWNLVGTTLVWRQRRWLLAQVHVEATPAPVPSIVYVDGHNHQAGAFSALDGMTAPFYGAG